jgi:hypothetical protein
MVPVDHKHYIIETIGCGCAMFDYDNDGWMDLLVLSGSRGTAEWFGLKGLPDAELE